MTADNSDPNTANNDDTATISVAGGPIVEIPTLVTAGIVALALLLAAVALMIHRRRQDGPVSG